MRHLVLVKTDKETTIPFAGSAIANKSCIVPLKIEKIDPETIVEGLIQFLAFYQQDTMLRKRPLSQRDPEPLPQMLQKIYSVIHKTAWIGEVFRVGNV